MLVIRSQQLWLLEEEPRRRFADRLFDSLARLRPAAVEARGSEMVRAQVRAGVDRALIRGITSQQGHWQWAQIALAHGPDFDTRPWAEALLEGRPRSIDEGDEQMTALYAEAARRAAHSD